jgi:hypothetical protein
MALEAAIRQQRPDVAVELEPRFRTTRSASRAGQQHRAPAGEEWKRCAQRERQISRKVSLTAKAGFLLAPAGSEGWSCPARLPAVLMPNKNPLLLLPFVLLLLAARLTALDLSEIEGTRWKLTSTGEQYKGTKVHDIAFRAAGRLISFNPADKTPNNDTWRTNGEELVVSFNDGFAIYRGQLGADGRLSGTGTNEKGETWQWSATRVFTPK